MIVSANRFLLYRIVFRAGRECLVAAFYPIGARGAKDRP
jgi:hypothetical protein